MQSKREKRANESSQPLLGGGDDDEVEVQSAHIRSALGLEGLLQSHHSYLARSGWLHERIWALSPNF